MAMSFAAALRASLAILGAAIELTGAAAAAADTKVDLELVLAVDVSGSMDIDDLIVQRDGYAAAFRHPDVVSAIRSGPLQSIAATYVECAGPDHQVTVLPWTL